MYKTTTKFFIIISIICISLSLNCFCFASDLKIGLILGAGGKNDKGFNQAAWEGAKKARLELGIDLEDIESDDLMVVDQLLREYEKRKFDLVISVGYDKLELIKQIAPKLPDLKIAVVDAFIDHPNVCSLVFKEHEGSFIVGMIAAMGSRKVDGKRIVGFIGGMDVPLIHKFEAGYTAGVKFIYKKTQVLNDYVGSWTDSFQAKDIAHRQIRKGASVIYHAAGASGNGLFEAVKEFNQGKNCTDPEKKCVFAVGVDKNQNYLAPGQVLTSMLKRVDIAVYKSIKRLYEGNLKSGLNIFDLKNYGIGYALDQDNMALLKPDMLEFIEKIKQHIINGVIQVPDSRKKSSVSIYLQ